MTREVLVRPDQLSLAVSVAGELVRAIGAAQTRHGVAEVVLTGGGIGIAVLGAVAELPDRVSWPEVELWWGDERFLPEGHPDRNETQARQALLDRIPLDPARVHPMPGPDGPWGTDVAAAAVHYATALAAAAGHGPDQAPPTATGPGGNPRTAGPPAVPAFDVVLLGVGPDAHVASLFPGRTPEPAGATVVGVTDSPKPPPTRISLTPAALNQAAEVWLLASGAAKADAVRAAFGSVDELTVPASAVRGRVRTRWFLDEAAAAGLS